MDQQTPNTEALDSIILLSHLLSVNYPYIPQSEEEQVNNGCIG